MQRWAWWFTRSDEAVSPLHTNTKILSCVFWLDIEFGDVRQSILFSSVIIVMPVV